MNLLLKISIGILMITAVVHLLCHPWHGTALNGKEDGGRYYLGSHGVYHEVSHPTFQYCIWQEYSDVTAIMLMVVSMWLLPHKKKASSNHAA